MAEQKKTSRPHIPEDARQHAHTAHQEMRQGLEAMFPPEVLEHHRKARKEMLLAWRSLIDHALERIDEKGK
ncbi:MAG: hypothetical protein JXB85_06825 [Anaerolineales bacterium]|nr:hypothetical protein [Anaerolineales bacterium]